MKRQALVVGINRYPSLKDKPGDKAPHLQKPAGDAEAIAQLLEQYGDFEVHRLPCEDGVRRVDVKGKVSATELEEAIKRLLNPVGDNTPKTFLLFFAGHGYQQPNQSGETDGFLLTSDANPRMNVWGLSLKRLRQLLQESPVRQQIVWLDCCHSGELFNFTETDLGEEKRGRDRCFIAASREFQVAYGGVLTPALLQALDPTNQPDGWVTNYSLKDFIEQALKNAPQHSACRNTGGQIILTGKQGVRGNICPYKGLEFFDFNPEEAEKAEDPKYFYGRTELTEKLWKKVRSSNFLAVLGASGSGKSSVVRAGLLYQLYLGEKIRESDRWKIYKPFTPGEHPLRSLEQVIGVKTEQLEPLIRAAAAERVVLVVDQFEEVFTQCRDEAERQQFFKCLMGGVERLENKLCLVLVMRDDFQHKCAEQDYAELATKIDQNLVRVKQMSQEELREAITKPAEQVELEIDRDLVNQIIADVSDSPGDLPLLQYTLTQLWENYRFKRLTLSQYNHPDFGGVKKALENHANQVYESLSIEQKKAAKRIFLELTRLGEDEQTPNTRQQVRQQDLVNSQQSEALVNQVVQHLAAKKLVVTSEQEIEGKRVAVVNIAHEALIRNWNLLREWLRENREALLRKQDIEDAAKEWRDREKPTDYLLIGIRLAAAEDYIQRYAHTVPLSLLAQEFVHKSNQRRQFRRLRTASILVVAFAGVLGFTFVQWNQNQEAQVRNLVTKSTELYDSQLEMQALIAAIQAGKKLESLPGAQAETKIRVLQALQRVPQGFREVKRLEDAGQSVIFSPDGQMLASANFKSVQLRKPDGTLLKTLEGHSEGISEIVFSPDGQTIASVASDKTVILWKTDGTILRRLEHGAQLECVSFSPDGQIIASGAIDGTIKLWRSDGTLLKTFQAAEGEGKVYRITFSPDGKTFASANVEHRVEQDIKLWTLDGKLLKLIHNPHKEWITRLKFSPDGQTIVSSSGDRTVKLWKPDGTLLQTLEGHGDIVYDATFSPDGKTIASGSRDGTIKIWNLEGKLLKSLQTQMKDRQDDWIKSVAFSPDGKTLISASSYGTITFWGEDSSAEDVRVKTLKGHTELVIGVSFSPDSRTLVSASDDGTIKLWQRDGKLIKTINNIQAIDVSFSPDGKLIASAANVIFQLWTRDGRLLREMVHTNAPVNTIVNSVQFSPDGQIIASAGDDGTIKLWSLDGRLLKTLEGHESRVYSISFSPDGQMIASASRDGSVILWKRDGTLLKKLKGHSDEVYSVSISPDGQMIASGGQDKTVKLWRRDGTLIRTLEGPRATIYSVAFSPDSQMIASANDDDTIKLWKPDGTLLTTFSGHTGRVNKLSFSPDGKTLASASSDKTIRLWNLDLDNLMERGCRWVSNYLNDPNANITEEDRHLCDGTRTGK